MASISERPWAIIDELESATIAQRRKYREASLSVRTEDLPQFKALPRRTRGPHAVYSYLYKSPERTPPYHKDSKDLITQAQSRGEAITFLPKRPEEHYVDKGLQMPSNPPSRIINIVSTAPPSITNWIRNEVIQKCVNEALHNQAYSPTH